MKLNRRLVIKKLEDHRHQFQNYGVQRIGLFGSFLKNIQTQSSDLDFLVVFKKNTFDNYFDLKFLLEKLFQKIVDLVIENNLKPALRYVKKEAVYVKV